MTYNEIIKALEEILNREYREDTVPTAIATIEFFECVYNLICRQNSKIEALQMDYNQLQSDYISANQNFDNVTNLWEVEKEKVEKAMQKVIKVCKELQTAKAEIESLKIANEKMYQACKEQESIQERECPTCYGTGKLHTSDWLVKGITKEQLAKEKEEAMREAIDFFKKEAIKEFAERLKDVYTLHEGLHITIDNLVKEMTEGEKE